jgi:hypothetical protein
MTTPSPPEPYQIIFERRAEGELLAARPFDQRRIMAAIATSLRHEPLAQTKNRKPLRVIPDLATYLHQLFPDGAETPPPWELRVGAWRVTYVVRGREVWVLRVVQKGRKTTSEALS